MKIAAFTSFTGSYLPNARIVAKSVRDIHPEWDFFALYNDRTLDDVRWENEPFKQVVFADWLNIRRPWARWAYDYSVVEFCTATKGAMTELLFDVYGYDMVFYLDPDVLVTGRFDEAVKMLADGVASSLLTPHLTDPEPDDPEAIWSHEMAALKHGTFNLGFFAFHKREEGRKFLRWWTERLIDYSHISFDQGLFTDQKWCNIAPYMFPGIRVITDRTYNVATWNMTGRLIGRTPEGVWTVNGDPMIFYHFSGFGHDFAWADRELAKFGATARDLIQLWNLYKDLYADNALTTPALPWHWGRDKKGTVITPEMRRKMRESKALGPFV